MGDFPSPVSPCLPLGQELHYWVPGNHLINLDSVLRIPCPFSSRKPCLSVSHSCCQKLSSSPATIFEMLAKDMRLLGQRKRTLLLIAHQAARASHLCRLCPTDLTEVTCPGECCTCSRFASQLRNPELRKPPVDLRGLQANLPNLCSRGKYYLNYTLQQPNLPSALKR